MSTLICLTQDEYELFCAVVFESRYRLLAIKDCRKLEKSEQMEMDMLDRARQLIEDIDERLERESNDN